MDTEIRYLQLLEQDLEQAAAIERSRVASGGGRPRRPRAKRWLSAVAATLAVAFVVGLIAQGDLRLPSSSNASSAAALGGERASGSPAPVATHPDGNGSLDFGAVQDAPRAAASPVFQGQPSGDGGTTTSSGQDLSKIIKDGSIALDIPKDTFTQKFASVVKIAQRNGGFVLSSETRGGDSGSLTVRVPAKRFDETMLALAQLGTVTQSSTKGQDVTAEFIDNQARLRILEARRAALTNLLAHATSLGTTLSLYNQLDDVQFKIEQIQGQLRYLSDQVAESTIKVSLSEPGTQEQQVTTNDEIRNPSIGRALERAVQGFLGVIATVIVGLGYLIPLAILAGLVLLVVTLARRRRGAG